MTNINNKTKYAILGIAFVAILAIFSVVMPNITQACSHTSCGYYEVRYPTIHVNDKPVYVFDQYQGRDYSYNYSSPNYVYNNYPYNYPYNNYNYNYYAPLSVSCTASTNSTYTGNTVTWSAYASGGNGNYTYSWSGTDGLYGYNSSVYKSYYSNGLKTAYVTVYSNGQSMTQNCNSSVSIYDNNYNYNYNYNYNPQPIPVYYNNTIVATQGTLDVACYADPARIRVNQPTTWTAEVTGGIAPYTYSWSGSGGLNGTGVSVIKYYDTVGEKNAIVTVTSADGKTGTRACANNVTVISNTVTPAPQTPVQPTVQPQNNQNSQNNGAVLSAASLFSLQNVPWGWIAILIILVLFATVMYLLFNRTKI